MKTQKSIVIVGIFTVFAVLGLLFAACDNESTTTVPVTGVTLDHSSKTLPEGATFTLTPTVTPSNATNKAVSWSSSDTAIASVVNGVVTAEAPGDATIIVTTEDGSYPATCTVTVQTAGPTETPNLTLRKQLPNLPCVVMRHCIQHIVVVAYEGFEVKNGDCHLLEQ